MSQLMKVSTNGVRLGMYVHAFGGSWFDHPFWRGRFLVEDAGDLQAIQDSKIDHVVIDVDLSAPEALIGADADVSIKPSQRDKTLGPRPLIQGSARHEQWQGTSPGQDWEQQRARAIITRTRAVVRRVFQIARLGGPIPVPELRSVVEDIVEGIMRDAGPLLKLARQKKKNEYIYLHSVAVCILTVNLANHIGLDESEVRDLGLAGLLHDVGKIYIDDAILDKPGRLTDDEWAIIRDHPRRGFELLTETGGFSQNVLDVCLKHHERMDGRGYPSGLVADELNLASRIGAICDVYDAVTSARPYKAPWSPTKAVTEMWQWEGHFDRDLLFSFMQSIGVFPPGILVRLRSERLGVVLDPGKRPGPVRALAFYSVRSRDFIPPQPVKVSNSLSGDWIVGHEDPAAWGFSNWHELVRLVLEGPAELDELASLQSLAVCGTQRDCAS